MILNPFSIWWENEGSAMGPLGDENAEAHVHRVSEIAWNNGAYSQVVRYNSKPFVYLACPYSHYLHLVRVERFNSVNRAAAKLMSQGIKVFSPISHTHPIAEAGDLPKDYEFWKAYDQSFLEHSYKLIILKLPGWYSSKGLAGEVALANRLGIPVEFMEEEGGSQSNKK